MKYYAAYGSNLFKTQMAKRCPKAQPVAPAIIDGWQLVFRHYATIEKVEGAKTQLGVWSITDECETILDGYEGVPESYKKEYIEIIMNGKTVEALIYMMNPSRRNYELPPDCYYEKVKNGYTDFGLDLIHLESAMLYTQEKLKKEKIKL